MSENSETRLKGAERLHGVAAPSPAPVDDGGIITAQRELQLAEGGKPMRLSELISTELPEIRS